MTTTNETPTKAPTRTATKAPTKPTATNGRDWFDQYLTFVKRIEAPVVRTTARMATRFAEYVPERPAFLASMPKVHELVDTGITVRKRMVDEQTRFARQMMKAMNPMLVRVDTVHVDQKHVEKHVDQKHVERSHEPARRPVRRTDDGLAARAS